MQTFSSNPDINVGVSLVEIRSAEAEIREELNRFNNDIGELYAGISNVRNLIEYNTDKISEKLYEIYSLPWWRRTRKNILKILNEEREK